MTTALPYHRVSGGILPALFLLLTGSVGLELNAAPLTAEPGLSPALPAVAPSDPAPPASLPAPGAPAADSPPPPDPAPDGRTGLKLTLQLDACFIQAVVEGSPAASAGLVQGSRIYAVDGMSTDGLGLKEVTALIKGPPGSTVTLTVRPPGALPRDVTLERAIFGDPPPTIRRARNALPRLRVFAGHADKSEMLGALEELKGEGFPDDLAEGYGVALAALYAQGTPEALASHDALLEQALEISGHRQPLVDAVLRRYLPPLPGIKASAPAALPPADPSAQPLLPPAFDPRRAQELARKQFDRLEDAARTDRVTACTRAAWFALIGETELLQHRRKRGWRKLEQALTMDPGTRLGLFDLEGTLLWSQHAGTSSLHARVLALALRYHNRALAQALLLEARRWDQLPPDSPLLAEARAQKLKLEFPTQLELPSQAPVAASAQSGASTPLAAGPTASPSPHSSAEIGGPSWPVEGESAPDFELVDVDQNAHRLLDLRGKVVLISLWATWCGPCQRELEAFKTLYERYRHQGLEILAISQDEDTDAVEPYVRKKGLTFPAGLAEARPPLYRASNIPVSMVIDRAGHLAFTHIGFNESSLAELERTLQTLLEAPGGVPQPLVEERYHAELLELYAFTPALRTRHVRVGSGPQGPQVWALQSSGELLVLEWAGKPQHGSAPLEEQQVRRGYGRFHRTAPMDLLGDRISARVLLSASDENLLVETALTNSAGLYIPGDAPAEQVVAMDLDGDRRDELVVAFGEAGCRAIDGEGRLRFEDHSGPCVDAVALPDRAPGRPEVGLLLATGTLLQLGGDGQREGQLELGAPNARVLLLRRGKELPPAILVAQSSLRRAVALDLEGDGWDELALLDGPNRLYVLDGDGTLLSRLTFRGSRLTLDAGDLNGDGRAELVVGGDGLGVVVLGKPESGR